ncbi:fasciclin domain-containing protein [bacterium]|nr:fasciclin domain-containing protein [bacterium]
MKTNHLLTALALATSLGLAASPAIAGGCGSGGAKATQASADVSHGIYDLAGEAGFTTLTAAIAAAGLEDTLNNDGPFTVFAPTDEAFASLPEGTLESLLADKDALTKVLLYHVTNGNVYAENVVDLRAAKTLNGEKVAINIDGGVQINDANVIKTDVAASNGVIHVIDSVLIPANL